MSELVDTCFIEVLMKHIREQGKIPKVQVERVIGPILGLFIEEALSLALDDELVMICAEFPLRKKGAGSLSTNIDWLFHSRKQDQLVFVEMKTTVAFDRKQCQRYCEVIKDVCRGGRLSHCGFAEDQETFEP